MTSNNRNPAPSATRRDCRGLKQSLSDFEIDRFSQNSKPIGLTPKLTEHQSSPGCTSTTIQCRKIINDVKGPMLNLIHTGIEAPDITRTFACLETHDIQTASHKPIEGDNTGKTTPDDDDIERVGGVGVRAVCAAKIPRECVECCAWSSWQSTGVRACTSARVCAGCQKCKQKECGAPLVWCKHHDLYIVCNVCLHIHRSVPRSCHFIDSADRPQAQVCFFRERCFRPRGFSALDSYAGTLSSMDMCVQMARTHTHHQTTRHCSNKRQKRAVAH